MKILRSIAPTIAILSSVFLLGIVNNSDAFEIVEFPSDTEDYSSGGYTYHMAYLETDVPYRFVDWYIDGIYVVSSFGDGNETRSYFYPYDKIPGTIKGKKYKITGEAWLKNDDGEVSRTASYTVRMFEPKYVSGIKQSTWEKPRVTGVYGYSELSRHYHDGEISLWTDMSMPLIGQIIHVMPNHGSDIRKSVEMDGVNKTPILMLQILPLKWDLVKPILILVLHQLVIQSVEI